MSGFPERSHLEQAMPKTSKVHILLAVLASLVMTFFSPSIAHGQNPMDPFNLGPPMPCIYNPSLCGFGNSTNSSPSYNPPPPTEYELRMRDFKASLDTIQNRGFAEKLYAAALRGIARVQKTRGSAAAIAYSWAPSGNHELIAVLNEVTDGQLFLAKNTLRATFINAGQLAKGVSTELGDDDYQAIFSKTMDDFSKRAANESELDYFNRSDQLFLSRDDSEASIRRLLLPLASSLVAERDRAAAELREKEEAARKQREEQARIAEEESRRIEQHSIEQSKLDEQRVQEYLASEQAKKAAAAKTQQTAVLQVPAPQAPSKHVSAEEALKELVKFLELPEKPLPHTHPAGRYYGDYAGKMTADFHTIGDVDAYRLYVSTPNSSSWAIDESIFFPNSVGIQDKIQLPKGARCEVLVEGMAATMVDGKKYVIAHCMNVQYPGFVMPQLEVLVEPGTLK